ncbi:dyslexia-associated protein KIAA0319-like [Limulus polyphemus]|uniref:Dyslexia-associated protein KIAA0319-like n=1 Tax=Limulus polyphemus TaxID=6850 RepID=A0ABM1RU90_LIMPO|nr:dyslexia-associated protein KIAA0319-like [Limulus polyphemus]
MKSYFFNFCLFQDTLIKQLELLLHSLGDCKIHVLSLDADRQTRRVRLIFIAERTQPGETVTSVKGIDVVKSLKRKLLTDSSLLNLDILSLDTVVCQNECSNHGSCDPYTKLCVCEAFWMQNIFKFYFGHRESNCDWSILYVVIISFVGVMAVAGSIWGIIFLCMRVKCRKQKKRHRYALLEDIGSDKEKDGIPRGKSQNSSLMVSDSESDTLFDSRRRPGLKSNGKPLNGVIRKERKIKA